MQGEDAVMDGVHHVTANVHHVTEGVDHVSTSYSSARGLLQLWSAMSVMQISQNAPL